MKVTYEEPTAEIIRFDSEDIITSSGGGDAILPDDKF